MQHIFNRDGKQYTIIRQTYAKKWPTFEVLKKRERLAITVWSWHAPFKDVLTWRANIKTVTLTQKNTQSYGKITPSVCFTARLNWFGLNYCFFIIFFPVIYCFLFLVFIILNNRPTSLSINICRNAVKKLESYFKWESMPINRRCTELH